MSDHTRYFPTAGVRPTRLWHGKYEGIIVDIMDPQKRGRVKLQIPQISGTEISNWAEPLGPWIPRPSKYRVQVQFIGGDLNRPVYHLPQNAGIGCTAITVLDPSTPPLREIDPHYVQTMDPGPGNAYIEGHLHVHGNVLIDGDLVVNGNIYCSTLFGTVSPGTTPPGGDSGYVP